MAFAPAASRTWRSAPWIQYEANSVPPADARLAARLAVRPPPRSRREGPLHQPLAADAQGMLQILARPRAEAVQRHGEARDSDRAHAARRRIPRTTHRAPATSIRRIRVQTSAEVPTIVTWYPKPPRA